MTRRSTIAVMSIAIFAIGVVLVIRTLTEGGGANASGVVLGLLFMAAGAVRFYLGWMRR
jgi:membrane protein CcdC involved in cytochrome C biogenesis